MKKKIQTRITVIPLAKSLQRFNQLKQRIYRANEIKDNKTQQAVGKRNIFFTRTTAQTNQSRSICIKEAIPKEERDAHTNDGEGNVPGVERGSLAVRRRCECGIPLELLLPRCCGRHTSGGAVLDVGLDGDAGHHRLLPRLVPCRSLSAPQRAQRRHLRAFPAHLHKHLRAHLRGALRR
jgi:hypothetical protein